MRRFESCRPANTDEAGLACLSVPERDENRNRFDRPAVAKPSGASEVAPAYLHLAVSNSDGD